MKEDFSAYIIKYSSPTFPEIVYLIWFTDDDSENTDQLLTLNKEKIFFSNNLKEIPKKLVDHKNEIKNSERLISWINRELIENNDDLIEDNNINLDRLLKEFSNSNFSVENIETFAIFINIFGDFARQNPKNSYLLEYENLESIKVLWTFYYEAIFWPRFKKRDLFDKTELPFLDINKNDLEANLKEIIEKFDRSIV